MIIEEGNSRIAVNADVLDARFDAQEFASAMLPTVLAGDGSARRAVVEVHRRVGGLPQRALLGGVKTYSGSLHLELSIRLSGQALPTTNRRCVGAFGRDLIPGIPSEFAHDVLCGLIEIRVASGLMEVDRGAFDVVETSGASFVLAAKVLAMFLQHDREELAATKIRELLSRLR